MNRIKALLVAAFVLLAPASAMASQGSCVMPTSGTVSGLTLVQDMNGCFNALGSVNSGATAPTNLGPFYGTWWLDTSTNFLKGYDGAQWLPLGHYDTTNHLWNPPIGGGTGSVSSATTTDLCSVPQAAVTVSGSTTITSFSNTCQAGTLKVLTFSGALALTHNATSMILPNNGSNITTAAGDVAWAEYLGSGNWKVTNYTKADGTALNASANFAGAVFFNSPITVTLGVNTNDWAPTGLATANVIRLTCSASINVTGLTASATDGKVIVVENDGATNNCTFTSQDASSTAANRFAFDRPMVVRPGRAVTIKYDITAARWRSINEVVAQPVVGGASRLKITNDPASGTTLLNAMLITADELTVEDGNGGAARLSSVSCSADVTASGAGGLDTGTVASGTWYSIYVLFNPTTNSVSCAESLQVTFGAITKPSGYSFGAWVGANRTNATTAGCTFNSANSACFARILQYGRDVQYVVTASSATVQPPLFAAAGAQGSGTYLSPTYAALAISPVAPPMAVGISVIAVSNYNAASNVNMLVAPNASYGGAASTNQPPINFQTTVGSQKGSTTASMVLESSNVYAFGDGAGFALQGLGWKNPQ